MIAHALAVGTNSEQRSNHANFIIFAEFFHNFVEDRKEDGLRHQSITKQ